MPFIFPRQLADAVISKAPTLLAKPLTLTPFAIKEQLLLQLCHVMLKEALQQNALDFLAGKWVAIEITDLQLRFEIGYQHGLVVRPVKAPDVRFIANSDDLLLIAAGVEDPDSLFFRRELAIEGDTELGLQVKNLLTSLDYDQLMPVLKLGLSSASKALVWLQQKSSRQAIYL
ncbi:ubiquinone anaerobic biosynthesis accessory factor UbiT [Shewanella sp.]|uniref:ubiquinone anaerobic biosynthesis accessory factor UbiT n=1 Tax=Shewanella sp. TaxID=50422 RepID=UPI003A9870D1